ncbi:MAG: hypothetical protein IJW73_03285 [Candidatus Gastranaerophilales bacterium]|nr:hypothetical protein [Candidatus Gastranaerophilales bacterium]
MDVKHSITFLFEKDDWKQKYKTMFLLCLIAAIPAIGAVISSAFTNGYMFVLTNRKIVKPNVDLPEFNYKKLAITGMKYMGFLIMVNVIYSPVYTLAKLASSDEKSLAYSLAVFLLYLPMLILADVTAIIFSTNLKFETFFKAKKYKHILVDNLDEYIKFALTKAGIMAVWILAIILFIGICFIPSLINPAFFLLGIVGIFASLILIPIIVFVLADLNAQFIRKIYKIKIEETQG